MPVGKMKGMPHSANGFMMKAGVPGMGKNTLPWRMKSSTASAGSLITSQSGMFSSQKPRPTEPEWLKDISPITNPMSRMAIAMGAPKMRLPATFTNEWPRKPCITPSCTRPRFKKSTLTMAGGMKGMNMPMNVGVPTQPSRKHAMLITHDVLSPVSSVIHNSLPPTFTYAWYSLTDSSFILSRSSGWTLLLAPCAPGPHVCQLHLVR
mmetsp:Transcript_28637/g.92949  ORF Transcript_28637/g.92949 Transcript_28637/m.92949 type:complete len:207 (-) Transcript_28637:3205-3825(-)